MRTTHPPLLPILRSRLQGELLAAVLLASGEASSISELSRRIGANTATVQREVDRLERAGIFSSKRVGRTRLVSANLESPLHRPLSELILMTFGPAYALQHELAEVKGVEQAFIFGSWAQRYAGVEGLPPQDIDVLVVGNPDRDELHEARLRAEERLHQEVSVAVRSSRAWSSTSDSFTKQLRKSPLIPVLGKPEKPVAKLVPIQSSLEPRKPGGWKGRVRIAEDFDELPEEIAAAFRGERE